MNPHYIDLIRELREAVGLFAGAMPITPREAWEEAIAEVCRVREIAESGKCWVCEGRARGEMPAFMDMATLKQHGYSVTRWGDHGWLLKSPDGADLMVGSYGCVSPTQWEAVAEGLSRIAEGAKL